MPRSTSVARRSSAQATELLLPDLVTQLELHSPLLLLEIAKWEAPSGGRDSLVLLGQPADTEMVVAALGSATAGFCPDGVTSVSLPYGVQPPDPASVARFPSPVLLSEVMEIRGYQSGGEWWVGVRSVSAGEVIQPAHGPIAVNGLRVVGFDSTGAVTAIPARVSHLLLVLRVLSGDSTEVHLDLSRGALR